MLIILSKGSKMQERESDIEHQLEALFGPGESPWQSQVLKLPSSHGMAIRITAEHASEDIHAHQARRLASKAFEALEERRGASEIITWEAAVALSELVTNAIRYHAENRDDVEVDVVWSPASETENIEETIDICVTNASLGTEGTPGMTHRGELAAEESNDEATHGRGLQIVNDYGELGQINEPDRDGRPTMTTFAVIHGEPKQPVFDLDSFDEAA